MKYANHDTVINNMSDYDQSVIDIACRYKAREYNRHIAKLIINELLDDKLSDENATEFMQYANILTYMNEGMFTSTIAYLESITVSDSLENVKTWLITSLQEANSI